MKWAHHYSETPLVEEDDLVVEPVPSNMNPSRQEPDHEKSNTLLQQDETHPESDTVLGEPQQRRPRLTRKKPKKAQLLDIIQKKTLEYANYTELPEEGILIARHVPEKTYMALLDDPGTPCSCLRYQVSIDSFGVADQKGEDLILIELESQTHHKTKDAVLKLLTEAVYRLIVLGNSLPELRGSEESRTGEWDPPILPAHRQPDVCFYTKGSIPNCPTMVVEVALIQRLSSLLEDQADYAVNPDIKLFLGVKVWRRMNNRFAALVFLYCYTTQTYLSAFSIGSCQINRKVTLPNTMVLNNAQPNQSPVMANLPTAMNQAMLDVPTIHLFANARPALAANAPQHVTIDLWKLHEYIRDLL